MFKNFNTKLIEKANLIPDDIFIADLRIGLGYICVKNSSNSYGLAYTFHDKWKGSCSFISDTNPITGRNLKEVISDFFSTEDYLKRGVALAAFNSYFNRLGNMPERNYGDPIEFLGINKNDTVGMVGFFGPFIPMINKRASALHIIEKKDLPQSENYILHSKPEILKDCSVVILSATSIINNTFDELTNLCKNARKVLIVGPSTPLLKDLFIDTPISIISGMIIKYGPDVSKIISEGGGTRRFSKHTLKLNLIIK